MEPKLLWPKMGIGVYVVPEESEYSETIWANTRKTRLCPTNQLPNTLWIPNVQTHKHCPGIKIPNVQVTEDCLNTWIVSEHCPDTWTPKVWTSKQCQDTWTLYRHYLHSIT